MAIDLGHVDNYTRYHTAELVQEAERAWLADLARGARPALRSRIAAWLYATAAWIEGRPAPEARQADGLAA